MLILLVVLIPFHKINNKIDKLRNENNEMKNDWGSSNNANSGDEWGNSGNNNNFRQIYLQTNFQTRTAFLAGTF